MRVYVAGRWTRKDEVREAQRMLREAGHEISHDWTPAEDPDPGWSAAQVAAYLAAQAAEDVDGVLGADVVVVLDDPTGRGLYVEFGIAIAHGAHVVVVGPGTHVGACVFYFLPEVFHAESIEEAVGIVGELAEAP